MRYAIFTDIHANLEALNAVFAKIDELSQQDPIDQLWFLGDLVGYGPNPNECIDTLRARTDVIIAGNHDWAAVGKLDLEDFSEAARISALWTAKQLTEEHRVFLADLPERIEIDECVLVHGSPFGPLWEYLTSEVLAERSFQYFNSRFCFVGHTHVPIIFQQPDSISTIPTIPLDNETIEAITNDVAADDTHATAPASLSTPPADTPHASSEYSHTAEERADASSDDELVDDDETTKLAAIRVSASQSMSDEDQVLQEIITDAVDAAAQTQQQLADDLPALNLAAPEVTRSTDQATQETPSNPSVAAEESEDEITPEATIQNAEERLNEEIEELLALLGLSQSMIQVTNEMLVPPEGTWEAPDGYRAIVNPGGVGQPRDGDARAAFMVYDTEAGFSFYRVSYDFEKTQEKIMKAKLPPYLATRLAYGR